MCRQSAGRPYARASPLSPPLYADTVAAHKAGKLATLLKEAGITI